MNDAVFISDLHLHPQRPELTSLFEKWVDWALKNTRAVYILGDFFHAWAGDDTLDAWSLSIAHLLARFRAYHIPVYFMVGNRDFLLGARFAEVAKIQMIKEPTVIRFEHERVLLVHGDRYCTLDKMHQWFRRLTRNSVFRIFFLLLPRMFREKIVGQVRQKSRYRVRSKAEMETVPQAVVKEAIRYDVDFVVHGHTHVPMRIPHVCQGKHFEQIVLSDWEENVLVLCYNKAKAFYYLKLDEEGNNG
jgi:UDP-2,3-diacylglucosamine hydrolase